MNEHIEPTVLRGHVATPTEVIDDGVVVLRDGVIAWVGPAAGAEAADVGPAAIQLAPGESHTLTTTIETNPVPTITPTTEVDDQA